jgi:hypothetical protein
MSIRTLYTYSGKVIFPDGAPSLLDVAVSLCREGRYAGASLRWWPVGLHCFVVADMLPTRLKLHGLLHDSGECITGDIPSPVKTKENREFEEYLHAQIYKSWGLTLPTPEDHVLIKRVDDDVLAGEVYVGAGTLALQEHKTRCPQAEELVLKYINEYTYADMLDAGGRCPIEFIRRYRVYRDLMEGRA